MNNPISLWNPLPEILYFSTTVFSITCLGVGLADVIWPSNSLLNRQLKRICALFNAGLLDIETQPGIRQQASSTHQKYG